MTTTLHLRHHTLTGDVRLGTYPNGSTAVQITLPDEGEVETLSVNLAAYGMTTLGDQFHVKDTDGLALALADAGVATAVRAVVYGPFNTPGALMVLRPDAPIDPANDARNG